MVAAGIDTAASQEPDGAGGPGASTVQKRSEPRAMLSPAVIRFDAGRVRAAR
ncbi:hypothetical protein ACVGVM_00995 [Pseudonocardia bannensis]|uniref:Uncharacterized protein n=1 Tax=Pseudonocardia bannensis TaxID=630973 RepID=A0A848DBC9_9PSEU|nr:hypothetical protein [Pseudonocardia bannensis]NMH90050.1 hypothetical protein [Pseudonocardia bannensis]